MSKKTVSQPAKKVQVKFDSIENQAFYSPKEMDSIDDEDFKTEAEKTTWINKHIQKLIVSKQKKAEERRHWIIAQYKKHGATEYNKHLTNPK